MPEKLKKILLNNWQLKALAMLLAVLVWAIISGREKTYSEKTLKIPVEIVNVSPNLEVVSIQPEEARVTMRATASLLSRLRPES
ncbi:MAG TPA: hypothetical protein VLQ89_03820, partial [Candidatus Binatia bacterium]|nr:hypothetical protein [Candidatus Binatia bacterium]